MHKPSYFVLPLCNNNNYNYYQMAFFVEKKGDRPITKTLLQITTHLVDSRKTYDAQSWTLEGL